MIIVIVTTDAGICETPSLPNNGSLEYTATGVGAVLKIVCNSGFKTSDTASSLTVAVCSEDGWTPDPSTIHCVQLQQTGMFSLVVKTSDLLCPQSVNMCMIIRTDGCRF